MEYFDKIIDFHLSKNLPKDVFIYSKGTCSILRKMMKELKGEHWPYNFGRENQITEERIFYNGFTFHLVDL